METRTETRAEGWKLPHSVILDILDLTPPRQNQYIQRNYLLLWH